MAGLPKSIIAKYGISKEAWRVYRAGKTHASGGGTTAKTTRRRRAAGAAKSAAHRGYGMLGGVKGIAISAALLLGAKYAVRKYLPGMGAYTTGVAGIATGAVGMATGLPTKSVFRFGLIDAASEFIYDLVTPGGMVNAPGVHAISNNNGTPAGYSIG